MEEVWYKEKIKITIHHVNVFGAQYRMGRDSAHDVCGTIWLIYFLVIFKPFGDTTFFDHVYEHLFKICN
jgi:hypothetical protein